MSLRPALATLALITGCATDLELGEQTSDVISPNRLSANALSANGLSMNRLSANRLSANALSSPLYATAEGRELMTYVARCALDKDVVLQVDVDGTRY